jgi:hypothetical protein
MGKKEFYWWKELGFIRLLGGCGSFMCLKWYLVFNFEWL